MEPITPQPQEQPQYQSPISSQKHFLNKKFIVTLIILVLLGVAAYTGIWYWQKQQTYTGEWPLPTFTPRPSISVTPYPVTINWPTFNSKLLNFSFKYPPVASYKEEDIFQGRTTVHTGKDVYFSDKNSQAPGFSILTSDFTAEDSVTHDFIQGSLSTGNFILIGGYDEKYQKKRQVASGVYEVVAYGNMECSPSVGAFLIVSPPKGSNLKYEAIYLYSSPSMREFTPSDLNPSDPCSPKESAINSKIDYFFSQKDPVLERSLNTAIEIASTFQVSNQAVDTSTWKTYTNTQYGFEIKYPESYSISGTPNGSNITFKSIEACKLLVSGGGEWPTDCQSYNILVQQNKISGPEMSKTFVAGIQAEKFSDSNGMWSNGTQVLVQFQKGQNWYIQTFTFNQSKSQIFESIMNQILSTFKFIE